MRDASGSVDTGVWPARPGRVRVTLLADHLLLAETLAISLRVAGYDVHLVEGAGNVGNGELLTAILGSGPGVALLDLDPDVARGAVQLVGPLARSGVPVVVLTGSDDRAYWGECIQHGARIVITKAASLHRVVATIRIVSEGRRAISREEHDELVLCFHAERRRQHDLRHHLDSLTSREGEVLGELMTGHTVCDIARLSKVSEATVRTQVKAILAKLQVCSQIGAVGAAHHAHWRPPAAVAVAE